MIASDTLAARAMAVLRDLPGKQRKPVLAYIRFLEAKANADGRL